MNNQDQLNNFYQALDKKKKKLHPSDFRLYNIARMPILANKTLEYSSNCTICKFNIQLLEELVNTLPDCLNHKESRKIFELNKDNIVSHLEKVHMLKLASYYSSLFTFLGLITGGITGLILMLSVMNSGNTILIFMAIGMISGFLIGRIKDKRRYRQKKQL